LWGERRIRGFTPWDCADREGEYPLEGAADRRRRPGRSPCPRTLPQGAAILRQSCPRLYYMPARARAASSGCSRRSAHPTS